MIGLSSWKGDLTEAHPAVARAVEGVDCIFHEAAVASVPRSVEYPLDSHAACVTGTLQILDAARRAGVRRLVYAASSAAYGDQPTSSKRESDLPAPISPYGAAKLAAELYCQAFSATYKFETVCLRYFNVFGPRQDPESPYSGRHSVVHYLAAPVASRRPTVYGDGSQSRDFTYVGNVVQGNLLAADAPHAAGRVINLADGRSTTLLQLLRLLNELLGTNSTNQSMSRHEWATFAKNLADITLARRYLNYRQATTFEEGAATFDRLLPTHVGQIARSTIRPSISSLSAPHARITLAR